MDHKRKITRFSIITTCVAVILFLISGFSVGIAGGTHLIPSGHYASVSGASIGYGVKQSIHNYWGLWDPSRFPNAFGYIGLLLLIFFILIFLGELITVIIKKRFLLIIPVLVHGVTLGFLPYMLILGVTFFESGKGTTGAAILIVIASLFALLASFSASLPLCTLKSCGHKIEEEETIEEESVEYMEENDVRRIIAEELERHVNERHIQEELKAAEDESNPIEEEVDEEAAPEEEPEDEAEEGSEENATDDDPFAKLHRRRKASFETKLKKSEADLRHKYYELRDYIKSYGVKNRISIPGDTFSAKRERYAFITIQGKHIKVYLPLDINAYQDSSIPLKAVETKKFADLPLVIRVQSDLSLKRAKKLVDDVMKNRGLSKAEE